MRLCRWDHSLPEEQTQATERGKVSKDPETHVKNACSTDGLRNWPNLQRTRTVQRMANNWKFLAKVGCQNLVIGLMDRSWGSQVQLILGTAQGRLAWPMHRCQVTCTNQEVFHARKVARTSVWERCFVSWGKTKGSRHPHVCQREKTENFIPSQCMWTCVLLSAVFDFKFEDSNAPCFA